MIAITFALPAESSGILRRLNSKRVAVSKAGRVFSGQLANCEIVIFHTGVGGKACQHNIEVFLESFRPELLISSGFAGSITDKLRAGDLIVAENFSDQAVVSKLQSGERFRRVRLLTTSSMVASVEDREHIAKEHNADAVDMETEIISQSCLKRGIPLLSLRVISDSAAAPFPAPPQVMFDLARQRTIYSKLIPYVMMHPSALVTFTRFARHIGRVRETLTNAIVDVVTNKI